MKNEVWSRSCIAAPSLISVGDFLNLGASVAELEQAGTEMLHIDILDGHFSPSMPLGFNSVSAVRKATDLFFDAHVMTENNDYYIGELIEIGADQIVFHAETEKHIDNQINRIHRAGIKAGVALKPATPLSLIEYVLEKCDSVLLMLINPGYAGAATEKQVPYAWRKVRELNRMIRAQGLETKVILDGRISRENIAEFGGKEANIFVAGSTCLDKRNLEASMKELLKLCEDKENS
ncbi:MAG: ribulose-phosphate 3-epimerase [Oscillospiraceae bacterium]|nr:ribulose-phosphate 3-epimerase [Oscillospiraceae bacterium]